MKRQSIFRAAACGLLLLAAFPASAAPSADSVAGALAAAVTAAGDATFTYDNATVNGGAVTLTNVKLGSKGGHSTVTIPALVVTGAADRQPGGFTAAHLSFDNGTAASRGQTVTWATAALDDVVIPSADEAKARARVRPFARATFVGISISGGQITSPVTVASASVDVGDVAAGAPSSIQARATGLKASTSVIGGSFAGAFVGMLDYSDITADITMDSAYDTAADTVTLRTLTIDAANIGKITIAGKASGLSLKGLTEKDTVKEARAAARLDNLTVRIDNAGFVERMLDAQAQMLGGTRDDARSQLVDGALPFALSFVKNEAFRAEFQSAMDTFMQDPRSLTITFAPAAPVPLGQVMRTAAHQPMTLPDLLSPSVAANN